MATIAELSRIVGGLSKPSKMPGLSYGLPAAECILGSILRKKTNSVCGKCYAHKGMYVFPNVRAAQYRRLETINRPGWTPAMIELIRRKYRKKTGADRVFRWHDSGDLQSIEHLESIVKIALALPDIRFWLPTKEREMVKVFGKFPDNLIVRVSAPMVGKANTPIRGTVSSTVAAGIGHSCPARKQDNECGPCRACWDPTISSVDYDLH